MDNASGIDAPSQTSSARAPEQLRFTGSGSEYFGIWIVNLLLTIVTLGICVGLGNIATHPNHGLSSLLRTNV
jgi:uncharacterized membrane protein YjgN (DUF898 family)